MLLKTAKRFIIFWSFVLVAAYLVYVYPLHRLTEWLGYPALLNLPAVVGFWFVITAILWLSFRSTSRALEIILYNWMGIGFVFFSLCFIYFIDGKTTNRTYKNRQLGIRCWFIL